MINIIFIAPPLSGKGTQSKLLQEKMNYNHISTGDLLRSTLSDEVKNIINNGNLADDKSISILLEKKINSLNGGSFILDGAPRTVNQAIMLDQLFSDNDINDYIVIYLKIDRDIAMKRVLGRLVCNCGQSYSLNEGGNKPKVENICDKCGQILYKRDDDSELKLVKRFDLFDQNICDILNYYKSKSILYEFDANLDAIQINNEILEIINEFD